MFAPGPEMDQAETDFHAAPAGVKMPKGWARCNAEDAHPLQWGGPQSGHTEQAMDVPCPGKVGNIVMIKGGWAGPHLPPSVAKEVKVGGGTKGDIDYTLTGSSGVVSLKNVATPHGFVVGDAVILDVQGVTIADEVVNNRTVFQIIGMTNVDLCVKSSTNRDPGNVCGAGKATACSDKTLCLAEAGHVWGATNMKLQGSKADLAKIWNQETASSAMSILTTSSVASARTRFEPANTHGRNDGDFIKYEQSGATAITGLTTGASYYVVGRDTLGFQLSATKGGAVISISGGGAGNKFIVITSSTVDRGQMYLSCQSGLQPHTRSFIVTDTVVANLRSVSPTPITFAEVMMVNQHSVWKSRTSAADNEWYGVTFGNNLFVAVSSTGSGNRVMTSPDGTTWTMRTSAADNAWKGVTFGNNLFVAVSTDGSNRVMTSPDGITWTSQTSAANNAWTSVIFGNNLFVAVSKNGNGNRVMTVQNHLSDKPDVRHPGWYKLHNKWQPDFCDATTAKGGGGVLTGGTCTVIAGQSNSACAAQKTSPDCGAAGSGPASCEFNLNTGLFASASTMAGEGASGTITITMGFTLVSASKITTNGAGTGLTLKYNVKASTAIDAIEVVNAGSGYSAGDKVTVDATGLPGRSTDFVLILKTSDVDLTSEINTLHSDIANSVQFGSAFVTSSIGKSYDKWAAALSSSDDRYGVWGNNKLARCQPDGSASLMTLFRIHVDTPLAWCRGRGANDPLDTSVGAAGVDFWSDQYRSTLGLMMGPLLVTPKSKLPDLVFLVISLCIPVCTLYVATRVVVVFVFVFEHLQYNYFLSTYS